MGSEARKKYNRKKIWDDNWFTGEMGVEANIWLVRNKARFSHRGQNETQSLSYWDSEVRAELGVNFISSKAVLHQLYIFSSENDMESGGVRSADRM